MEKSELSFTTGRNRKWCSCFGKVWQFLKWLNTELPLLYIYIYRYIYQEKWKTCPHKNQHTNVHVNIVHNSQKVEIRKMSNN